MAILKTLFFWLIEYAVTFLTKRALKEKESQERIEQGNKAVEELEKAKKEGADEAKIIELEEDVLNGRSRNP